jgi:hypothetical protein
MRNFTDYVERTKNEVEGEDYIDVLFEGFAENITNLQQVNPMQAFILGFISGSGINLKENVMNIENILKKQEFKSVSEVIKNFKVDDKKTNIPDLKTQLGKNLSQLKSILVTMPVTAPAVMPE